MPQTLIFLLLFAITANAGEVVSFFPTGSVKQVQQTVVRFSTDMVPMGDPRSKNDPFKMKCNVRTTGGEYDPEAGPQEVKHTTRWADSKNWVLEFEEPLKSGIACTFVKKSNLKDVAGENVNSEQSYSFTTGGPAILQIEPEHNDIEPDQYFVLLTDGAIDPHSVKALAYFEVSGIPNKVGVKIIEGKDREDSITAAIKNSWQLRRIYEPILEANSKKPFAQIKQFENFVVISANQRFPEKSTVVLNWVNGILSKSGVPVTEKQSISNTVIEPFNVKFICEKTTADRPCNPILDMRLEFSKVIPLKSVPGVKLVSADGKSTWTPEELKPSEDRKKSTENPTVLTFKGPFPEKSQFNVIIPKSIKDEIGRSLTNQNKFPLSVATDEYTPLIKFQGAFGLLESKADPALPVSVRNIEKNIETQQIDYEASNLAFTAGSKISEILEWYRKVERKYDNTTEQAAKLIPESLGTKILMPKPSGEREFELIGIPFKKPGFYVVELKSFRLGNSLMGGNLPMYVASSALVTDMAVHFKKGRESSLVWVTQLSTAKPVRDADVTLVNNLGQEFAKGKTDKNGILHLGDINFPCEGKRSWSSGSEWDSCTTYVFAKKDGDVSFVSSSWKKGIESYRFNVPGDDITGSWGSASIHSILDRMAAQRGESINMKHIIREYHMNGFSKLSDAALPKRVLIVHEGSRKTYTLPFTYDKSTGAALNRFAIPKNATLGRYDIYVSNTVPPKEAKDDDTDMRDWTAKSTGHFIVSEYRLPLMKASIKIQGEPLIRPTEVKVDLSASYLSGGPAKDLKVKLRTSIQPGFFQPQVPGASDFTFFSEPVKTGVIDYERRETAEDAFIKVQDFTLKSDGGLLAKVSGLPQIKRIQDLHMEMEYSDPNGEVKTASATVPMFPSELAVGLRAESWAADPNKISAMGVITGNTGKPLSKKSFTVEAFKSEYITHRKRLVGGFYSYDSKVENSSLGKVCDGKSDENGRFKCEPKGLPAGNIILQAKVTDEKGHATYATTEMTVFKTGSDNWWTPSDSDRIDIIPEKLSYEPNEKAKLVVQSPFPKSTVLITVEREGIMEAFVTDISRDKPSIEVPLNGQFAPNVFISALALRGRVGDPKPTALLDLGKPAMKMGIVEVKVGWRDHELKVQVKSDKTKYKARDKAQIEIEVKMANGQPLPPGSEVTIAAIDESLLRLKENTSWELLKEMMGQRGLAVETSSGQNQVVGRRHFGAKAKTPGGGGGSSPQGENREFFDPVLFWQPQVKLDSTGKAKVTILLNDSMTSFRVVAIATGGFNHFGNGSTNIQSTKDLIIYSGFSPVAREGDNLRNALTLRNTTEKSMLVDLEVTSKEIAKIGKVANVELKPSEAKKIAIPFAIPTGISSYTFQINAKDKLSGSEDSMKSTVKVETPVPVKILQATLFQLDKSYQIPVKQPSDAIANKGGLIVDGRSTLVTSLSGVKSYMQDYPYTCLEQQVSRGIALEDKAATLRIIDELPSYIDGYGLLKFFTSSMCGSAQLSRYVLNIMHENGYKIPEETRGKIISGIESYIYGRGTCNTWWQSYMKDTSGEDKVLLMETLSRYGVFDKSMLSTVQITPNIWKNETATAWFQLLKRQPDIENRDVLLKQAENILRARTNFQGTLMNLQGGSDDESQWVLFTSRDQEAMGLFGIAIDEPAWKDDVGRVARGVIARLRRGVWDTTMANAWGVTQLKRFSAKYEKDRVSGETKIAANEVVANLNWKNNPIGESKVLSWPKDSLKSNVPVKFEHAGGGKPWMTLQIQAAVPLKRPMEMGYKIFRKITPVFQQTPGKWRVGDVANIELTVTAKADQPWVVIRDPIPSGATPLGMGLSGSSVLMDGAPKKDAATEVQPWPTEYDEKSLTHFTSYAGYLPRGTYRVDYRIRLNSAGDFKLPPSRVEAMYSPETFVEAPVANWQVAE
ncbi:alpha-2-macroglobulin family protein [Bdellovibrio sp. HCB185ZH]|uniref:alpha-2-macroglobulin family protein n=1 Tax=Bdellovibrio sp. HCB185ZH TaxID=3394235 RepID=UPI0039A6F42F